MAWFWCWLPCVHLKTIQTTKPRLLYYFEYFSFGTDIKEWDILQNCKKKHTNLFKAFLSREHNCSLLLLWIEFVFPPEQTKGSEQNFFLLLMYSSGTVIGIYTCSLTWYTYLLFRFSLAFDVDAYGFFYCGGNGGDSDIACKLMWLQDRIEKTKDHFMLFFIVKRLIICGFVDTCRRDRTHRRRVCDIVYWIGHVAFQFSVSMTLLEWKTFFPLIGLTTWKHNKATWSPVNLSI